MDQNICADHASDESCIEFVAALTRKQLHTAIKVRRTHGVRNRMRSAQRKLNALNRKHCRFGWSGLRALRV
jgi:hypothetical protein